ncbi:MAB_1171c family putative transporter [Streptomyces milbemycinicus]|uniref:MAB_1171c family putative transporter n=1 Tax=Streptomyces milbemycinicus TaxID=476552 RepID=A0ABW8M5H1_9ACTN
MLAWLENIGIVALWSVAIARTPQALRRSEQRPLWFAIVLIAVAMSMHLEPVTAVLARFVSSAHRIDLIKHLVSILDAAAVLWFILQAAGRQRRTIPVFSIAVLVMGALALLDILGPPHDRNQIAPSSDTPSVPDAYWWIFFAFHLIADTICGFVCWSYGRRNIPRLLRYALRLFGTGILLASLLWVLKLAYLVTRSTVFAPLFSPVTGIEALFMAAGAALPLMAQLRQWWRYRSAYRGLELLWRDLTAATPDVVFAAGSRLRAVGVPLQLRLYRRVIEIRDAMIVLRDYVSSATLHQIRRHADRDDDVQAHLVDAYVTAYWLVAALQARRDGRAPHAQEANLTGDGAQELTEEIGYLLHIAAAYQSPSVRTYRASLADPA